MGMQTHDKQKKLCAKNLLNPSATKKLFLVELAHTPLKIMDLLLRKETDGAGKRG